MLCQCGHDHKAHYEHGAHYCCIPGCSCKTYKFIFPKLTFPKQEQLSEDEKLFLAFHHGRNDVFTSDNNSTTNLKKSKLKWESAKTILFDKETGEFRTKDELKYLLP